MKDCCKTGDEQTENPKKPWGKWLLYLAIVVAIVVVINEQIRY